MSAVDRYRVCQSTDNDLRIINVASSFIERRTGSFLLLFSSTCLETFLDVECEGREQQKLNTLDKHGEIFW